jgi:hypothetical protein
LLGIISIEFEYHFLLFFLQLIDGIFHVEIRVLHPENFKRAGQNCLLLLINFKLGVQGFLGSLSSGISNEFMYVVGLFVLEPVHI